MKKEIIEEILKKAGVELDKAKNKKRGILMSTEYGLVCWCFVSPMSGKKICRVWEAEIYKL